MEDFNSAKTYALHDIGVYMYNNFNEECLDQANYLKRAIIEIENKYD